MASMEDVAEKGERYTVNGSPRTTSKKKRRKSEERDRVADWLDSRQEVHTLPVIQVIQRYGNWSDSGSLTVKRRSSAMGL